MADIPKGELANLDDLKDWIPRGEPGDDAVLQPLLDMIEELLESKTGKNFTVAATIVDEPHDGTGTPFLKVDSPPVTVDAAIKVGEVLASPDSTIPAADIIVDQVRRRITYQGNRLFKRGTRNIFVSYTSAENLPATDKAAVLEATAFVYNRRGVEHLRSQSIGDLGNAALISSNLEFLPLWRAALGSFVFA